MHTPSTRILSALAYDCGIEDYDPTDPVCLELVDALIAGRARRTRSSESPDRSSARGSGRGSAGSARPCRRGSRPRT